MIRSVQKTPAARLSSGGFYLRRVLDKIQKANQAHHLIDPNDKIVMAFSGGPDSTALLYALSKLRRRYNLEIFAGHLDHGLQTGSARMAARAKKISRQLDIPFHFKKVNVSALAKRSGRSIEEEGRIARYRFLSDMARRTGSSKIATAHTLDDQAETVLLRLIRGSGLKGLGAIPFKRPEGKFQVIRPLLLCSKKEIVAALKEAGISFVQDPTNRRENFTRNRVRRRLLPLLEKSFNPQIKEALCGLQEACAEAQSFIESQAKKTLRKCLSKKRGGVHLEIAALKRFHPTIQTEILSQALKRFTQAQLKALRRLIESPAPDLKLSLQGTQILKSGNKLQIRL